MVVVFHFMEIIIGDFSKIYIAHEVLTTVAILAAMVLFYIGWHYGNLLGGWDGSTFLHGLARISFSFTMGMLGLSLRLDN